ncbi:MAG: hypothetical protein ABFC38_02045 [Methanospirillum sp.]
MLFCCRGCDRGPCELRLTAADEMPPTCCPFDLDVDSRWHPIPSGRSTMPRTGLTLLPGPFCEIPATAIVRATAEGGRYTIVIGALDRVPIPCSRAAFNEAVTAMEAVNRAAGV